MAAVVAARQFGATDDLTSGKRQRNMTVKTKFKSRPRGVKSQFIAELAEKIVSERKKIGLSQKAMADRTDGVLTNSLICNYEMGTEPTLSKFIAICLALHKTPEEMLPTDVVKMLRTSTLRRKYFKGDPTA